MHMLFSADGPIDLYRVGALREAGHVVEVTGLIEDARAMAADGDYQAVVLDLERPTADCMARFAGACGRSLLVVITPAHKEAEHAALLQAGADACVIHSAPFIELEARLEALARLVQRIQGRDAPPIELVAAQQAIRVNGRATALSAREFRLMEHMLAHAGEVVGLERLQQHIWGEQSDPRPDLVRTLLSRLRRKLDANGGAGLLRKIAGHGYLLAATMRPTDPPPS